MEEQVNWGAKLKEALERTEFLCLGTSDEAGAPWTNPLGYAYDGKMNLYILSEMQSRHIQNALKRNTVSVSIYKTERFETGDIFGLQITGKLEQIVDSDDLKKVSNIYFNRLHKSEEFKKTTSAYGGNAAPWQFFKISPEEVWCFDTRQWKDGRKKVPQGFLSNLD